MMSSVFAWLVVGVAIFVIGILIVASLFLGLLGLFGIGAVVRRFVRG